MNFWDKLRRWFGYRHLSPVIADSITIYYLGFHGSSDRDWNVGITDNVNYTTGKNFKLWQCSSFIEAEDTKKYFTGYKHMQDATPNHLGNEFCIYIFQ
jgi:hypothetical protein